jgi:hypothetical protein
MTEELIRTLATELDKELAGPKVLTPEDRQALEALLNDIQRLLQTSSPAQTNAVLGRLRENTGRFEVSHPNLTMVMAQVINALSTMGF